VAAVVLKFGGSSVATPERLRAVARRVVAERERGDLPVVVVSAMGKTTDELLALARATSPQVHRRELDMLLTSGERISMALLAMAVRDLGWGACSLTGSQAGIVTTPDHNEARIVEVRPHRVQAALDRGDIVIDGGFQGVSTEKEVTTLGRGGSDTTAVALAGALQVECRIFSDVDGVYTADPKVVPEARRIPELGHGEVLELGLRGARVLAAEAVDLARRLGVTIHARSTFQEGGGTIVTHRPRPGVGRAVAVASDGIIVPAELHGPERELDSALEQLVAQGIGWRELVVHRAEGGGHALLLLDPRNHAGAVAGFQGAAGPLVEAGGRASAWEGRGTATLVGEGIAEALPLWRRARRAALDGGIVLHRWISTAWGLTAVADREHLPELVRAWHREFLSA
jgi:aspartate kinase